MEAVLDLRNSYRNEYGWKDTRNRIMRLINLDLDDDENMIETLCRIEGRDLFKLDAGLFCMTRILVIDHRIIDF